MPYQQNYPCSFSVDVEDGVSIAMRDKFGIDVPQTERVVTNTRKILELLGIYAVKGTFFTLGKVAEKFPYLIKEISEQGHELAVHGYNHYRYFLLNYRTAKEELSSAKKLLEDLSGMHVLGHRAPAFSIYPETSWVFDVLIECGFTYDSSIMPIAGFHYGWRGFPEQIVSVETPSGGSIIEVPLPVIKVFGKNVPFSGGSYLRLFPFRITKNGFKRQLEKKGPGILYLHPYELDVTRYPDYFLEEMRKKHIVNQLKIISNWWNRGSVFGKLDNLLTEFDFKTMHEIVDEYRQKGDLLTFKMLSDKRRG